MAAIERKKRKASISEEDVALLLQKYTAATILALLQEVAHSAAVKINWDRLIQQTSTGISDVREYRTLWRHLAYHFPLEEKLDGVAGPLDDDSDLEFEVEPFPAVGSEATAEAAACVKVLIASASPAESGACPTVKAPLTINIPAGHQTPGGQLNDCQHVICSPQGKNITIPVTVPRSPLPSVPSSIEGLDGSAPAGQSTRRKRKLWTAEEDKELIAAVQKFGEGNWATILKGDFKHDRTASQLSQRWAIIKKRHGRSPVVAIVNSNPTIPTNPTNSTNPVISDVQLAARQAFTLALDMPMGKPGNSTNFSSATTNLAASSHQQPESSSKPNNSPALQPPPQGLSQAGATKVSTSQPAKAKPVAKKAPASQAKPANGSVPLVSQAKSTNGPVLSTSQTKAGNGSALSISQTKPVNGLSPNPFVQAAAVAAGARIAPPSAAASLLKAAQSRNAVHVRPGVVSSAKSSLTATKTLGVNTIVSRPNFHYIHTGMTPSPPVYSSALIMNKSNCGRTTPASLHHASGTLLTPSQRVMPDQSKSAAASSGKQYGSPDVDQLMSDNGNAPVEASKVESSSEAPSMPKMEQTGQLRVQSESKQSQPEHSSKIVDCEMSDIKDEKNVGDMQEQEKVEGKLS